MLKMFYGAQQSTPCVQWSHMLLGCLMFGLCELFSCGMASYCGHAGWQGWPLAKVAASHCLMYWLLSHWWVGLDPSIADRGACEAQGWCQPSSGWDQMLAQLNVQSMKSWDFCQPAGGLVILPRERTGHSKHPLPTTQEKTLHMDITRWSIPKIGRAHV